MIFFTIVVLPALSRPLHKSASSSSSTAAHPQHQNPHLLVLETRLSQYRQHLGRAVVVEQERRPAK